MKIGFMEIVVIFIVALLVIGPNKLPEYAKKLGVAMREFKKASSEITKDIKEDVIDPLEEAQAPIREAVEPFTDLSKQIKGDMDSVTKGLNDLAKPVKAADKKAAEEAPAAQVAPVTPIAPADAAAEIVAAEPFSESVTSQEQPSGEETATEE